MGDDNFNDDDYFEFTPEPGAKIEQIAPVIARMTKKLGMDAEIIFPNYAMQVPQAATAADIIKAYYSINIDFLPEIRPGYKPPPDRGPHF